MSQDNFWTDELAVEFATWSCNQAPTLQGRYTDVERFKKSKMPKKERIYVTLVNHYFMEKCQNRYAFESTYIIPEEKYPAIKAAIERCLNDEERLSVSILRQAESEAFYAAKRKDYKRPIGNISHWSSELYHDMYEEFDDYLKSKEKI